MKKAAALAVVGGDLRQAYLARLLRADGHEVSVYALERQAMDPKIHVIHDPKTDFAEAEAVILPMPVLQDEKHLNAPLSNAPHRIETIFDCIPSGKLALGGSVQPSVRERAAVCHVELRDYLTREELAIKNAVPAALAKVPRYGIVRKLPVEHYLKKRVHVFRELFQRPVVVKIVIVMVVEYGIVRPVAERALGFDDAAAHQQRVAAPAHRLAEALDFLGLADVHEQHLLVPFEELDILPHAVGKRQVVIFGKYLFQAGKQAARRRGLFPVPARKPGDLHDRRNGRDIPHLIKLPRQRAHGVLPDPAAPIDDDHSLVHFPRPPIC